MMIDQEKVTGAELPPKAGAWTADDVILYHLGIGAGAPPTDPGQLAYTYEHGLRVLPTFGVIPPMEVVGGIFGLDGLDISPAAVLHGEQEIEVHGPIPVAAGVETRGRVAGVYDKGKGAVVVVETKTFEVGSGQPLFTNRFSSFVVGAGGFGGEAGPASPDNDPPDREPDHRISATTLPQQALIYRLSGDKNPLHAEPAFAAKAGFERPILHGLCSYGVVCRAVIDTVLGGDVLAIAAFRARFAGIVFPGETIEISVWEEEGRLLLTARTAERGEAVLTGAAIALAR